MGEVFGIFLLLVCFSSLALVIIGISPFMLSSQISKAERERGVRVNGKIYYEED